MINVFYLVIGIAFAFALLVQGWLKSTYARWSKVRNSLDASGASVARHVLDNNALWQVQVGVQSGALTDHYDPRDKSIALSERIYVEPSIASAAIAAHECGHAIQDKENYGPMRIRDRAVPIAILGSRYGPWAVIGGWFFGAELLIQIGFLLYAGALILQVVNLPVEFDASRRARDELESMGMNTDEDRHGAKKVLRAAAMTYVAGSATAMTHLIFILFAFGRSLLRRTTP